MAISEYYVTVIGGATKTGTLEDPFDWASMSTRMAGGAASAGDRYNIQEGTYTLASGDTWTNDGTAGSPIIFQGCATDWTPISPTRLSTNLTLSTTNMPYIHYTGNFRLSTTGSNYLIFRGINYESAYQGACFYAGAYSVFYGCAIVADADSASAVAMYTGNGCTYIDCDFACTGASNSSYVFNIAGISTKIIGCYFTAGKTYGILVNNNQAVIVGCVCYNLGDYGVYIANAIAATVLNCTFYGKGIGTSDTAYIYPQTLIGNHCTNSSAYGIHSPNAAFPGILAFNRTRDNDSGDVSCGGDWATATSWGHVTETSGGIDAAARNAAEFWDYTNTPKNLNLRSAAACKGVNFISGMDIGALQRPEPTLPNTKYVIIESPGYGDHISGSWTNGGNCTQAEAQYTSTQNGEYGIDINTGLVFTPTLINPATSDVRSGVLFGTAGAEIGTYDPLAPATWPAASSVFHTASVYGPTGSDYTPTLYASDISNCTQGNIKSGVTIDDVTGNYTGSGGGGASVVNGSIVN